MPRAFFMLAQIASHLSHKRQIGRCQRQIVPACIERCGEEQYLPAAERRFNKRRARVFISRQHRSLFTGSNAMIPEDFSGREASALPENREDRMLCFNLA